MDRKEKAKVLGGERRDRSLHVNFSIAPSFMVSTRFDGTSVGFRLPRWCQWLKKKKKIHLPMQEIQETWVRSLGWEYPLEYEMVTSLRIPAWKKRAHTHTTWRSIHGNPMPVPSERNLYIKSVCMCMPECFCVRALMIDQVFKTFCNFYILSRQSRH